MLMYYVMALILQSILQCVFGVLKYEKTTKNQFITIFIEQFHLI